MSHTDRWAFFRQSGWMIMTTVAGGVFMSAVHVIAASMEPAEYGVFFTLLRVFLLLGVPAGGLQTVFAQQAAGALSEHQHRELTGATRAVLQGTFIVWLATAALVGTISHFLISLLKISNPAALWITVVLGLASLWLPVLKGSLQGSQNFAGLGWVIIVDGVGRFSAITVIVLLFQGQAAGGMLGALIGQSISFGLAIWFTRRIWLGPTTRFEWRLWLRRVIPLTLSSGAIIVMSNTDVILVQSIFGKDQTPFYMAAAMIGFALTQFITPLAVVMFPKIARSAARAEKTDALYLTLKATMILGGLAALACTLWPWLPLRILYFRNLQYVQAAPLVPWFAWALLLITLVNVLLNNLLARARFEIVPWLVIVALAYITTLLMLAPTLQLMEPTRIGHTLVPFSAFRLVILILGAANLLLLAVTLAFTQKQDRNVPATPAANLIGNR